MRRALRIALLAIGLIVALVFGYAALTAPRLDPAALLATVRPHDVRILRDHWGVPHVFGRTDADVAYGLAWAHAEDDFPTIQAALLAARGRLASVLGEPGAANDYLVHLLRVWDVVDARYETDLDPRTRAVCEAYAEGINHYAALHPELAIPQLYPARGKDVVAGFVHKLPLFFGLDRTLRELYAPERRRSLTRKGEASWRSGAEEPPFGSNAFAVGPGRSADGHTRLLVNSHQPWEGAVTWYEVHLRSDEGWDAVGGLFPGAPVVLHGHNRRLGWAHTVNRPDLVDVYVLTTHPDDLNQYLFEGAWRELEVRTAPIRVKLLGPLSWTFHREVLWSVYGPVVRRPHGTYAIRYAGMDEVRQVEQWYRMNKAGNFDEWQAALGIQALPSLNVTYADAAGNVQYVYNALLPQRAPGYDWSGYLPGDTSETLWTEFLPFERLPRVTNPASDFVQNCNSTPFLTTVGAGNPDASQYAGSFGIETRMTNRALRALELLGGDASITHDEFLAYKFDRTFSRESAVAGTLRRLLDQVPEDEATRDALGLLRGWDLTAETDSTAMALAVLTLQPDERGEVPEADAAALRQRLAEAADELKRRFGRLDVPWSQVLRLRRGPVDVGLDGGPDLLHAIYARAGADGRLVGTAGDSYVLVADWDRDGRVRSWSVHQYGSATLDAGSPHYADQSRLFAERRLKPVWLDEADIRANLEREYRPGEAAAH
jgi:penicillin amidase/acyl-homoserine-lactone acylase